MDTNPIPVKEAMALMGLIQEHFRLPLCPMDSDMIVVLRQTLMECGLFSFTKEDT